MLDWKKSIINNYVNEVKIFDKINILYQPLSNIDNNIPKNKISNDDLAEKNELKFL
jgi:hypothetical protein